VLQVVAGRVKLLRRKACNPDRGLLLAVVVVVKEDGAKKLVEDNQDPVGVAARRNANLEDVVVEACAAGPVVNSHKDTIRLARFQ
jgi:hypothetical protein